MNGEFTSEYELYDAVFKKIWKIHERLNIYKKRDLEDLDKLIAAINMFFVGKKTNLITAGEKRHSFDV